LSFRLLKGHAVLVVELYDFPRYPWKTDYTPRARFSFLGSLWDTGFPLSRLFISPCFLLFPFSLLYSLFPCFFRVFNYPRERFVCFTVGLAPCSGLWSQKLGHVGRVPAEFLEIRPGTVFNLDEATEEKHVLSAYLKKALYRRPLVLIFGLPF